MPVVRDMFKQRLKAEVLARTLINAHEAVALDGQVVRTAKDYRLRSDLVRLLRTTTPRQIDAVARRLQGLSDGERGRSGILLCGAVPHTDREFEIVGNELSGESVVTEELGSDEDIEQMADTLRIFSTQ